MANSCNVQSSYLLGQESPGPSQSSNANQYSEIILFVIVDGKGRFWFSVLRPSMGVEGFGSQYLAHRNNANKVLK